MRDFHDAPAITRVKLAGLDDSGEHQVADFSGHKSESATRVLRLQQHGLTSNPPADAYGYALRMGESDRMVALGFETKDRPKNLPPGVTALYNAQGNILSLHETRTDWNHGGKGYHLRNAKKHKTETSDGYIWQAQASGKSIFLGKQGPWYPVVTTAGPSQCVYASLGPPGPDQPDGDPE